LYYTLWVFLYTSCVLGLHPSGLLLSFFFPPNLHLEWESDGAEDEDSALALLDAIEEDFHRGSMGKRYKIKGRRELQNLKSSINYDVASVHSRSRRGKAQVL
jgi:hypothetical protein